MGKRSNFERVERDFYKTPLAAVEPLAPFLPKPFDFYEPCAGDGRLVRHLESLGGNCVGQSDISPEADNIDTLDALSLNSSHVPEDTLIITNPPWGRRKVDGYIFHRMIEHFAELAPTWLLADADWLHTVQAKNLIDTYLLTVVSIGRVKWMEDTNMTGKDNCCWYQFFKGARSYVPVPKFYGRGITPVLDPQDAVIFI